MSNYLDGYAREQCQLCGLKRTAEGYDGCVGELKGVMNACCGHGDNNTAYVQFNHDKYSEEPNKKLIQGDEAVNYIRKHSKIYSIAILLILLSSCATERIANCETQVIDGKLTTVIHVERSGRLHRRLVSDSLAHVLRMERERTKQLEDSLSFEKKKSKHDLKAKIAGLRTVLAMEKQRTKQLEDSLTEARKTAKIEGRTNRTDIRRTKRAEIVKEKARAKPWMWFIIGFALAHVVRWVFIIIRLFVKMPL